jgi:hypothetical protein
MTVLRERDFGIVATLVADALEPVTVPQEAEPAEAVEAPAAPAKPKRTRKKAEEIS